MSIEFQNILGSQRVPYFRRAQHEALAVFKGWAELEGHFKPLFKSKPAPLFSREPRTAKTATATTQTKNKRPLSVKHSNSSIGSRQPTSVRLSLHYIIHCFVPYSIPKTMTDYGAELLKRQLNGELTKKMIYKKMPMN